MLTSPDSTFTTIVLKWLNLWCQFESFTPDCLTHFVKVAISAYIPRPQTKTAAD